VLYCTANPTACIGAVDVAAGTAAGVPLTGVPVPHAVPNTTPISVTSTNTIAASEIRFSQNSISFGKIESTTKQAYTYDDLVASMRTNGWKGDPVDVVRMPDGRLTSIDNTRIMAAREAGIDAQVNVRSFDAPLTADEIGRFTKGGQVPSTWGDAVMIRINSQSGRFGVKYPYGADQLPRLTGGSK
ncbi:MAG: hypothetical protein LW731_10510, partial [Oxalobacteraceae bacterium]|nr:hypothetical protein [Oxalobacteraceae bacterium]